MKRTTFLSLLVCALVFSFASLCMALTDEEVYRTLNFNIITPGARALGFGGAFIGLADDATAAEANPAGLTILVKPELFGELRYSKFNDRAFYNSGGLFGTTTTNLQFDNGADFTFFSLTYPTKYLTLAVSRQVVMDIDSEVNSTFEFGSILWGWPVGAAVETTRGSLSLQAVDWNISLSKNLTETLSAGFTLRACTLKATSRVNNFVTVEGSFGKHFFTKIGNQSDTAVGANFGVLWRPRELVSVGFVFRNQPAMKLPEEFVQPPDNLYQGPTEDYFISNTINIPDSYGFGISLKPSSRLTIAFDVLRIKYSELVENFQGDRNAISRYLWESGLELAFDLADANEYHAGAEYVLFLKDLPFALRGGYYYDPAHRIHLDENLFQELNDSDPAPVAMVFSRGDSENHYTFGLGFSIRDSMQIDFAYDWSKVRSQAVSSFIFRFR